MEIRANYILVGIFTLIVLLGGVGFTLWTASSGKDDAQTLYDISFEEGVRGLSVNNDVLFSGIRVGRVTEIKISHVIPGAVRVRVAVAADTPVRENSRASIEARGITGSSIISISGGTRESPLLVVPEHAVGEILYEPSTLQSMFAQVPEVLQTGNNLLHRLQLIASDENIESISTILSSLSELSSTLARRTQTIDQLLSEAETIARNFDLLISNANEALSSDVKATSKAMSHIAMRVDNTLQAMEPGLKQFASQGLQEMRMLMVEARNLVNMLTRVSRKLETDPRRFFFGDEIREYKAP
ncbi:MlaD family protein [Desulfovibrio sp. OttesenSCG-928-A18]|nr:MlaD family protein [Desulfovibrio sp. OttesenSCG-928-A18]